MINARMLGEKKYIVYLMLGLRYWRDEHKR